LATQGDGLGFLVLWHEGDSSVPSPRQGSGCQTHAVAFLYSWRSAAAGIRRASHGVRKSDVVAPGDGEAAWRVGSGDVGLAADVRQSAEWGGKKDRESEEVEAHVGGRGLDWLLVEKTVDLVSRCDGGSKEKCASWLLI